MSSTLGNKPLEVSFERDDAYLKVLFGREILLCPGEPLKLRFASA